MDEFGDRRAPQPISSTEVLYHGLIWQVRRETFDLGEAGRLTRDVIHHPGAVAVLALDEEDRLLLIQQYRHPVGTFEWELPAGLLDVPGEPAADCAARELREEADLTASRWDTLLDHFSSPGSSSEALRIFLARDLAPVPEAERHRRTGEELGMPSRWVPLEQAREGVLAGRLGNPSLVIGVFAACALRDRGWDGLRPADAPWPARPACSGE